jgi:uncharacterized membrane protein HdeD (DUF308 family)
MTVTTDPREHTVKAFIKRKTESSILLYLAFFFIFIGIIAIRYSGVSFIGLDSKIELALGAGIGIALIAITYYRWRCPACGKLLGLKVDVKACPHCKAELVPYWKPDKPQRIAAAYSRKKTARSFLYAIVLICAFLALTVIGRNQPVQLSSLYFVLGVIVVAFGISEILVWRCPNCKSHLGRGWNPADCPRCNTRLRK